MRRVERHAHDDARDQAGAGQGQDPADEDLAELLPVDAAQVAVDEGDADDGARDALRGGHGQAEAAGQQHGDGGAQLHAVAAGGAVLGDAIAQVAHDVVAEGPEAEAQAQPAHRLDPDGRVRGRARHARAPRLVLGREGPDGVGHVVGAVRDRHDHGRRDLRRGPQVLDLVVEDGRAPVHGLEPARLVADHVAGHAVGQRELDRGPDAARVRPRQRLDGFEVLLGDAAELRLQRLAVHVGVVAGGLGGGGRTLLVHGLGLGRILDGTVQRLAIPMLLFVSVLRRVVVGYHDIVLVAGQRHGVAVSPQRRADEDVIKAQASVFLDESVSKRQPTLRGEKQECERHTFDNSTAGRRGSR